MKTIEFGALVFGVSDAGNVCMVKCFSSDHTNSLERIEKMPVCRVEVAGENEPMANGRTATAEERKLRYVNHEIEGDTLTLVMRSCFVEVTSTYTKYEDTNAVRVLQTVKNIFDDEICLELVDTVGIVLGNDAKEESKDWYFHRFTNARYTEAMPDVRSLFDLGMKGAFATFRVETLEILLLAVIFLREFWKIAARESISCSRLNPTMTGYIRSRWREICSLFVWAVLMHIAINGIRCLRPGRATRLCRLHWQAAVH